MTSLTFLGIIFDLFFKPIGKRIKNATERHIVICHIQVKHISEVNKYNKTNKGIVDFIPRQKEVTCKGIHYCSYVKKNIFL